MPIEELECRRFLSASVVTDTVVNSAVNASFDYTDPATQIEAIVKVVGQQSVDAGGTTVINQTSITIQMIDHHGLFPVSLLEGFGTTDTATLSIADNHKSAALSFQAEVMDSCTWQSFPVEGALSFVGVGARTKIKYQTSAPELTAVSSINGESRAAVASGVITGLGTDAVALPANLIPQPSITAAWSETSQVTTLQKSAAPKAAPSAASLLDELR